MVIAVIVDERCCRGLLLPLERIEGAGVLLRIEHHLAQPCAICVITAVQGMVLGKLLRFRRRRNGSLFFWNELFLNQHGIQYIERYLHRAACHPGSNDGNGYSFVGDREDHGRVIPCAAAFAQHPDPGFIIPRKACHVPAQP